MSFQERAKNVLRANGGRITPQRELLLDLLAGIDDSIDADQLFQLASEQDPNISLPTVYRTLNTLESERVITARYLSSEHERKIYKVDGDEHTFHFTCRKCGKVTTFQSSIIEQFKDELSAQLHADVITMCLCAGGLCADCRNEEQTMTLDQLKSGQPATVRRINGQGIVRRRLMDMGLIKGVAIEMVKTAPMGDPIEYLVRGYHLSLRKNEAQMVEIELC